MQARHIRDARNHLGWTQQHAAARLRVSQSYLSMIENGERPLQDALARRIVRVYGLGPDSLPAPSERWTPREADAGSLAEALAGFGYPGFAYLRKGDMTRNPAEVLLTALAQPHLEARVFEGLPWLLVKYWRMEQAWLVSQARLHNLQNRLGFVVSLARKLGRDSHPFSENRDAALEELESTLRLSLLAREDSVEDSSGDRERARLRKNRSADARRWNMLTAWRVEHLRYAD